MYSEAQYTHRREKSESALSNVQFWQPLSSCIHKPHIRNCWESIHPPTDKDSFCFLVKGRLSIFPCHFGFIECERLFFFLTIWAWLYFPLNYNLVNYISWMDIFKRLAQMRINSDGLEKFRYVVVWYILAGASQIPISFPNFPCFLLVPLSQLFNNVTTFCFHNLEESHWPAGINVNTKTYFKNAYLSFCT